MRHNTPWGPSPALGHYTFWPAVDAWELSQGARTILGIGPDAVVTSEVIMRHQHPDDAHRTARLLASRGGGDGKGYSYQHRILDDRGMVHEVVAVGTELPGYDARGPRSEGFIVDLSEVGEHRDGTAPMVPVEFDPDDLVITPCPHCASWWAEIDSSSGTTVVREWHQALCPEALRWSVPSPSVLIGKAC